ncbi:helix-turn-helix transcriptional regulator [Actinacidiphila glaucinigra]|uniref:helix-turn-helix transcriptional regulator n=1 Tax=Actinacidiphila glaucinigra TaxID=235986 RepID=UPI0035E2EF53
MRATSNGLGEFLRASRARVDPGQAGLIAGGSRRVAGLRREEVAVLAGVSADYYARLEQGRERNPSAQVVDAVGRALRLDADAQGHLFRLAGLTPSMAPHSSRALVHPSLLELLDAFPGAAAYVLSPAFDVLATNEIATALLAPFAGTDNMVRVLFRHPAAREVFTQWPMVAEATVHALRLNAGIYPQDRAVRALVDELLTTSDEFRSLWSDQTVGGLSRAYKVFQHPEAGRIELTYQTFDVRDAPGQQLLVGTPAPGTASAARIASLGATRPA